MVQSHLYARLEEIFVFRLPAENGVPVQKLHKGDWLGVVNRQDEWIHVISTACEGWVRAGEVESRPPFQLHIHLDEGESISYVNFPDKK